MWPVPSDAASSARALSRAGRIDSAAGPLQKTCLEHDAHLLNTTFDMGGVVAQPNILDQGAPLRGEIGPLHVEVLDESDRVAIA